MCNFEDFSGGAGTFDLVQLNMHMVRKSRVRDAVRDVERTEQQEAAFSGFPVVSAPTKIHNLFGEGH